MSAPHQLVYARGRRRWPRRFIALLSLLLIAGAIYKHRQMLVDHVRVHLAYRDCVREKPHPSGVAYCYNGRSDEASKLRAAHPDMLAAYGRDAFVASPAWERLATASYAPFAPDPSSERTTPSNCATLYLGERTAPDGGVWLVCVELEVETPAEVAVGVGGWRRPMIRATSVQRPPLIGKPTAVLTNSRTNAGLEPLLPVLFQYADIMINPGIASADDRSAFMIECRTGGPSYHLVGRLANDGSLTFSAVQVP